MQLQICLFLSLAYLLSYSQDSLDLPVTNSFKSHYGQSNPTLHYTYNDITQTHDYSGNWDLDGDGKKDSLYFVGNGGAHLYFSLKIVLSNDNKPRDYSFILLDMPMLSDKKAISNENDLFPAFVVDNFDNDTLPEVYIVFDDRFSRIPAKWKRRGVSSNQLLLNYIKGDIVISNYK